MRKGTKYFILPIAALLFTVGTYASLNLKNSLLITNAPAEVITKTAADGLTNRFVNATGCATRGVFFSKEVIAALLANSVKKNGLFVYIGTEPNTTKPVMHDYPIIIRPGIGDVTLFSTVDSKSYYLSRADCAYTEDASDAETNALIKNFLTESGSTNAGVYFPESVITKILNDTSMKTTGIVFYYALEGTSYRLIMRGSNFTQVTPDPTGYRKNVSRTYCPPSCGY